LAQPHGRRLSPGGVASTPKKIHHTTALKKGGDGVSNAGRIGCLQEALQGKIQEEWPGIGEGARGEQQQGGWMPPFLQQPELFEEGVGRWKGGQTPEDESGGAIQLFRALGQPIQGGLLDQPTLQTFPGQPVPKDKDLGKKGAGGGWLGHSHGVSGGGRRPSRLRV
jgi:hypothetical protein